MKRICAILLLIVCTGSMLAAPVDSLRIAGYVNNFLKGQLRDNSRHVAAIQRMVLDGKASNLAIVTLDPAGWVMVSTDDVAQPVYGFNVDGTFNMDAVSINPGMHFVAAAMNRQIRLLKENPGVKADARWSDTEMTLRSASATTSVEPLIKVNWNQGSGWNTSCPANDSGPGGHVYVGCVAVAMGQAMSVFQYPLKGTGTASYYANGYGRQIVNFSDYGNYNWSSMIVSQSNASIADFLYHCAVTVEMNFSPNGSGSTIRKAASALKNYFGYTSTLSYVDRSTVTSDADWQKLLNAELDNGRPIIYSGVDKNVSIGHAFNIDGYSASGDAYMYHLNWGWSGANNGYYSINVLNPGTDQFNSDESVVIGIRPVKPGPTDVSLSNYTVTAGMPVGTVVGSINVTDELLTNHYTYALRGTLNIFEEENPLNFKEESGVLKTTKVFDYVAGKQNKDGVEVTVKDSLGHSITKTFTINILQNNGSGLQLSSYDATVLYDADAHSLVWKGQPVRKQVRLFSLDGRLVMEAITSDAAISVNSLAKGIYLAEIDSDSGLTRLKFMVK